VCWPGKPGWVYRPLDIHSTRRNAPKYAMLTPTATMRKVIILKPLVFSTPVGVRTAGGSPHHSGGAVTPGWDVYCCSPPCRSLRPAQHDTAH
jgi:hypothetical protein